MRSSSLRLALVVAALAATSGACRASSTPTPLVAAVKPVVTTTTTAVPVPTTVSPLDGVPPPTKLAFGALATVPKVTVYDAPGSSTITTVMTNPTIEGVQLAMFADDREGDWVHVRLPMRPNGAAGWIRASDVRLAEMTTRIVVDISDRRLRVLDDTQAIVFDTAVAVGKPSTPTTLGRFFVDIWLPNPGRPYGTFMLSIGGFSDVLKNFAGGRGQLALHGWADQSVMGKNVSNGCVRMRNQDIAQVAKLAPPGTPIEIVA